MKRRKKRGEKEDRERMEEERGEGPLYVGRFRSLFFW